MARSALYRLIPVAGGAAGAGALSLALGATPLACLPALIAGGIAAGLLSGERAPAQVALPEQIDPFETCRPLIAEILRSFGDPLLLAERQQVTMANDAALDLLGSHIVGEDVRLAIRHPAAADKLTGAGSEPSSDQPIELVGIGEAERHWEFKVHDLGAQRKLVRLSDRSGRYLAEKMRVDFVANASHELRTPLATLIGFIETLEDAKAAEDKRTRERFLGIMADEARRMRQLIDDLISLSRIEADKFSPPDSAIALAPLMEEVINAARAGLNADNIDRLAAAIDNGLSVCGDRAQLSQVLYNLIGNALKYGRPGTPIRIAADAAEDEMVRITVIDEGDGIPPEHLPRLTERFYRVDPSRSRAMGGTGLGLAIVKHIVERHRGQLQIRSELGVGTTVSVLLPAAGPTLS